jgi:predicted enzyme related to lactoylglutathione lyase
LEKKLYKIGIIVKDTEEASLYFKNLFQMEIVEKLHVDKTYYIMLKSDSIIIELMPQSLHKECKVGFHHICYAVDDVGKAISELKEKGANILAEPFDGGFGITLADITGPDGILIRLFNRK